MKEEDWLYDKKTLPLVSSETRHDQIVRRKTEAFLSHYTETTSA